MLTVIVQFRVDTSVCSIQFLKNLVSQTVFYYYCYYFFSYVLYSDFYTNLSKQLISNKTIS